MPDIRDEQKGSFQGTKLPAILPPIQTRSMRFDKYHRSRSKLLKETVINWFSGLSPVGNPEEFRFDDEQIHQKKSSSWLPIISSTKKISKKATGRKYMHLYKEKNKRWYKRMLGSKKKKKLSHSAMKRSISNKSIPQMTSGSRTAAINDDCVNNDAHQNNESISETRIIHLNFSDLLDDSESGLLSFYSSSSSMKSHPKNNSSGSVNKGLRTLGKSVPSYYSPSGSHIASNNVISTAKYNIFTFFPRSLFEQFRRIANFYFLLLVILQFLPVFAIVNPMLCALPLIIIVFVTSLKDGAEDLKRHASDRVVNNSIAYRLSCLYKIDIAISNGSIDDTFGILSTSSDSNNQMPYDPNDKNRVCCFIQSKWRDIQVGDVLLIRTNEEIPADCIVLGTSEPSGTGLCYTETQNLDGETNLKIRHALHYSKWIRHPLESAQVRGNIEIEEPNPHLYSCKGKFSITSNFENQRNSPVSNNVKNSSKSHCRNQSTMVNMITRPFQHLSQKSNLPVIDSINESSKTSLNIHVPKRIILADSISPFGKGVSESQNISPSHSRKGSAISTTIPTDDCSSLELNTKECEPITITNLLLRGCVLRNTDWVVACVVYTGKDTKIIRNSGVNTPSKRSRIERQMNPQIIINFVILFIICLLASIVRTVGSVGELGAPFSHKTFSVDAHGEFMNGFITFWFSLIIFQTIVPISLYITIEICKSLHAYFIHSDYHMWDPETKESCVPKSWNLSDDLGQIEYLFSDKTGTLTRNIMTFKKCSIGGVSYGLDPPDNNGWNNRDPAVITMIHYMQKYGQYPLVSASFSSSLKSVSNSMFDQSKDSTEVDFVDPSFWNDILEHDAYNNNNSKGLNPEQQSSLMIEFFTMVASCHTVLVVNDKHDESHSRYKAQSPDEAALVSSARSLGFAFVSRVGDMMHLKILNEPVQFKLLHVLEFNSFRKRMSIIVKKQDGTIVLYCKGADDVIYDRLLPLSKSEDDHDPIRNNQEYIRTMTHQHLERWAEKGLRTLCFAMRIIQLEEFQSWSLRYQQASMSFNHRELLQDTLSDEIERDLILLGATAIEDQLQDRVPETLAVLRKAGIKTWVLTGDKLETAINIGFSSCLLTQDQLLFVVSEQQNTIQKSNHQYLSVQEQLRLALSQKLALDAGILSGEDIVVNRGSKYTTSNQHIDTFDDGSVLASSTDQDSGYRSALIIDGAALKYALTPQVRMIFLELATRCSSVICCRVSPVQKARVVELVKKLKHATTLVVGDGANDVGMLRTADVGVGIRGGKEGQQAVMASDYTINQFKYLTRLLLVHGRWSYHRSASVTLMSFYKNIVFSLVLLWYQVDCRFTAQFIYDYMYMLFWNLFFCVAPILVLGILDKDVIDERALEQSFPQLYKSGIRHEYYSIGLFFKMLFEAIYQSLVCYFIPAWIYSDHTQVDKTVLGTVMAVSMLILSNLVIGIANKSWTIYTGLSIILSFFMFILLLFIFSFIRTESLYGIIQLVLSSPLFYITVTITVIIALTPKIIIRYWRRQYFPTDMDLINESMEKSHDIEIGNHPSKISRFGSWFSSIIDKYRSRNIGMNDGLLAPPPPLCSPKTIRQWFRRSNASASQHISMPKSLWNMQTGRFERLRGFAFSQEGGMVTALLHNYVPFGTLLPAFDQGMMQQCKRPQSAKLDERIGSMI